jgi:hypothetical protein
MGAFPHSLVQVIQLAGLVLLHHLSVVVATEQIFLGQHAEKNRADTKYVRLECQALSCQDLGGNVSRGPANDIFFTPLTLLICFTTCRRAFLLTDCGESEVSYSNIIDTLGLGVKENIFGLHIPMDNPLPNHKIYCQ